MLSKCKSLAARKKGKIVFSACTSFTQSLLLSALVCLRCRVYKSEILSLSSHHSSFNHVASHCTLCTFTHSPHTKSHPPHSNWGRKTQLQQLARHFKLFKLYKHTHTHSLTHSHTWAKCGPVKHQLPKIPGRNFAPHTQLLLLKRKGN